MDLARQEDNRPLWVMGVDGPEIPITELPFHEDTALIDMRTVDRKTMRAIKWAFLKTAIKFFFSR